MQFPEGYETCESEAKRNEKATVADILKAAREIFHPYGMNYKYCDWWTIYRVGQRVCNKASHLERIFLAGDAIHSSYHYCADGSTFTDTMTAHSPKGGQGMNVSQQDTYNLTWKIAGVLRGQLSPKVLNTYEQERLPIARALISVDNDMAKVLSARANRDEAEVQRVYQRLRDFSGPMLSYRSNSIVSEDGTSAVQDAATGLPIGFRFPDANVFSQADGALTPTITLLKSNGLWRLLIFAGDVSDKYQLSTVNAMGDRLRTLQQKYESASARQKQDFLEILLFHASPVSAVESSDFHDTFFPIDGVMGRNYFTIFGNSDGIGEVEEAKGCHQKYGIDVKKGALAVVRPDQVIAWVGGLSDVERMEEWFAGFMIAKDETKRRDSGRDESMKMKATL